MFQWQMIQSYYNSIVKTIKTKDVKHYDEAEKILKEGINSEEIEFGVYDELFEKFVSDFIPMSKLPIRRCDPSFFTYRVSGRAIYCKCNDVRFIVVAGSGIFWDFAEKITAEIRLARSGSDFLQIKKEGTRKIITIFDNQKEIFDHIYLLLNVEHNGMFYGDLGMLRSYLNSKTYGIFEAAYDTYKSLNDNWRDNGND